MLTELNLKGQDLGARRAGLLPYLTLLLGAAVVIASHYSSSFRHLPRAEDD